MGNGQRWSPELVSSSGGSWLAWWLELVSSEAATIDDLCKEADGDSAVAKTCEKWES